MNQASKSKGKRATRKSAIRARRKSKLKARAIRNALKSSLVVAGPAPGSASTRFDINEYGGTPGHIRHIGQVKRRRGQT